jgi:hypothetical protein
VVYDAGRSVEGREQAVMNEPAEEERENVEDDGGLRQRRRLGSPSDTSHSCSSRGKRGIPLSL